MEDQWTENVELLGEGKFGKVYKAQHRHDNKYYAVKVIPINGNNENKERVKKEVEAISNFSHENIVRYNNCWVESLPTGSTTRDYLYIQQELCERGTLTDWLYPQNDEGTWTNSGEIISPHRDMNIEASLFYQIVEAVAYIHSRGIVHRDLRPDNIFLADSSSGTSGNVATGCPKVKLGDFGLICNVKKDTTGSYSDSSKHIINLDWQMSTDQSYKAYNHMDDIHALGLIFFQLLNHYNPIFYIDVSGREDVVGNIMESQFPPNFEKIFPREWGVIESMVSGKEEERPKINIVSNWVKRHYGSLLGLSIETISRQDRSLIWNQIQNCQNFIRENGKVVVQDRLFELKNVLPEDEEQARSVLCHLEGVTLEELTVRGRPVLFANWKLPQLSCQIECYIPRHFHCEREVRPKILLDLTCTTDTFIISTDDDGHDKLVKLCGEKNEEKIKELLKTSKIHLLNSGDIMSEIQKYSDSHPNKNIHFLAFGQNKTFTYIHWLHTFGSISLIKKYLKRNNLLDLKGLGESEIFKNRNVGNITAPILIAGESGTGKSTVLRKLAHEIISSKIYNSFVIFPTINDFMSVLEKYSGRGWSKRDIVTATIEMVTTSFSTFELSLLECWMEGKVTPVTLHWMLAGLDTLGHDQKENAVKFLLEIKRHFPTVQLWASLSTEMQNDMENKFVTLCHKIKPFTETEQISFLENSWKQKFCGVANSDDLKKLAKECIWSIKPEFARLPLHCSMLSKIYEEKVQSNEQWKVDFGHTPLTTLYSGMIDKIIFKYFKEVKGVQNLDDDLFEIFKKEIERRHIYLAVKLLFPDFLNLNPNFLKNLNIPSEITGVMKPTLTGLGIIAYPLGFIHQTNSDYFTAVFIRQVLTSEKFARISEIDTFSTFLFTHILASTKSKNLTEFPKFNNPILVHFLNEMLVTDDTCQNFKTLITSFKSNFDVIKTIILAAMQDNYLCVARTFLECLNSKEKNKFLKETKNLHQLMLEVLTRFAGVEFFKYVCELIENWYKMRDPTRNFRIPQNLLKTAVFKGQYEIATFLVKERGFGPEIWNQDNFYDKKNEFSIIHLVISRERRSRDLDLEKKEEFLKCVIEKDNFLLEKMDHKRRKPILLPTSHYESFKLKLALVKLGADVNAFGEAYKNCVLNWKCYLDYARAISPKQYHEILEAFVEQGFNQFNLVSKTGDTVLLCAVKTYFDTLEKQTLEIFRNKGANFNIKDSDDNTVLHICIENGCKLDFIKQLIECGSGINIENQAGKNALGLAIFMRNTDLVRVLQKIKQEVK